MVDSGTPEKWTYEKDGRGTTGVSNKFFSQLVNKTKRTTMPDSRPHVQSLVSDGVKGE